VDNCCKQQESVRLGLLAPVLQVVTRFGGSKRKQPGVASIIISQIITYRLGRALVKVSVISLSRYHHLGRASGEELGGFVLGG
jgi:hypothetical protein